MAQIALPAVFGALSDPIRLAIVERLLREGERSAGEIAEPFAVSKPAISKHLKVLEDARLITRSREAQYRPAKLDPAALKEASQWIEEYRQFWEERFDRLSAYMETLIAAGALARDAAESQDTANQGKAASEEAEKPME